MRLLAVYFFVYSVDNWCPSVDNVKIMWINRSLVGTPNVLYRSMTYAKKNGSMWTRCCQRVEKQWISSIPLWNWCERIIVFLPYLDRAVKPMWTVWKKIHISSTPKSAVRRNHLGDLHKSTAPTETNILKREWINLSVDKRFQTDRDGIQIAIRRTPTKGDQICQSIHCPHQQ